MTNIKHTETTAFSHSSVLLDECIKYLAIKPNGFYVDGTVGGGGHAFAILERLSPKGMLLGIDCDSHALYATEKRLKQLNKPFTLMQDKHENIKQILKTKADGFLLDLGVSSHQLDTSERGFSYRYDAPLDMRMDDRANFTAHDLVNSYSEEKLINIIKNYGEERYARRIAFAICRDRPINTTLQLVSTITSAVPKTPKNKHPAKRTFQAIRIEVNGELARLEQTIKDMAGLLKPQGRICIITFHSLEDRIVKQTFRYLSDPCRCPKDIPYCVCGKKPALSIITKKPIIPTETELLHNNRAHSAKLRVVEGVDI